MDEESFSFDVTQVREVVRKFPAHVMERASALKENLDLAPLKGATDRVSERVKSFWDEGGH